MIKKLWAVVTNKFQTNKKVMEIDTQWEIVSAYGLYIENNPPSLVEIRDVSELPYSKKEIISAISMAIIYEDNDKLVDAMRACAFALAYFQENIGQKPLSKLGDVSLTEMQAAVLSKDIDLMKNIQARIASNQYKEKYEKYIKLVDEEILVIEKEITVADQLRKAISAAINQTH